MKRTTAILAGALLALVSTAPAALAQDEDLDVTMQVLEDVSELDAVTEMRGPSAEDLIIEDPVDLDGDGEADVRDGEPDEETLATEREFAGIRDDFEHDDVDDDVEDDLDDEDDFEETEEVDDDDFLEDDDLEDEEPGDDGEI